MVWYAQTARRQSGEREGATEMKPVTALVTGVGAPVGVSVIKALRSASLPVRVVGVDSEPLAQGLFRVDSSHVVPSVRKDPEGYLDALVRICRREGAQIIFSGWEGELPLLAGRKPELEERSGAVLPLAQLGTLLALDKWQTVRTLAAAGVPVPDTVLPEDHEALAAFLERHPLPYIVKPRCGTGGRGLWLARTEADLTACLKLNPDVVVQERLLPDDREYTVGVFCEEDGAPAGVLALKRSLAGGLSYRMEVDQQPAVCAVSARAASALGLAGPANVQLRLTVQGPKVFEVNPRCSSATCVRANFGLNEPEMAIRRFVLGETLKEPVVSRGICLRFWEELYLPPDAGEQARAGRYPARGEVHGRF